MADAASFQGISDVVAEGFMDAHGRAAWGDMEAALNSTCRCPKLTSYWRFEKCGCRKITGTCNQPTHHENCPVPALPMRNGNLQQMAYSLFLFMRDVAQGDFVGWIDERLAEVSPSGSHRIERLGQALVQPLRNIHGLSDKVLNMVLSELLLGTGLRRPHWVEAGGGLIAVDTLVHNFLHRTGILHGMDAQHSYGPACYRPGGCADVIRVLSAEIDAKRFNRAFPSDFPRFVQKAIWSYCAGNGMNICNGNKIEDHRRCAQMDCRIFARCARRTLQ